MTERRAGLPAVDRVLRSAEGGALIAQYGRSLALDAVRKALDERRQSGAAASVAAIIEASADSLARTMQPSQRRVFNLTGTVLHNNLGRAPLGERFSDRVEDQRSPVLRNQRAALIGSQDAIYGGQPRTALRHDATAGSGSAWIAPRSSWTLGSPPAAWVTNPISAAR